MSSVHRIALAVPLGWEYIHFITEGILQYHAERGDFSLRDFRFDDPNFVPPDHPPDWEGWNPHGFICAASSQPDAVAWLLSAKIPAVNVTVDVDPKVIPCVHATGAAPLGVRHFLSLGIKNIASVALRGKIAADIRFDNFCKEMQKHGLTPLRYDLIHDPVGSQQDRLRASAGEPEFLEFLRNAPKPLGILALNDDFARTVCAACNALNLRIPTDVAVIGVDDSSAARVSEPPITSIRPPGRQVGYEAMRLLDALIQGKKPPKESILVQCSEIIIRQSTQVVKDDSIARAKQMIETEATRGLTVTDLVNRLAISRSNLEAHYKEYFGVSPAQEIKRVKFDKAKELLKNTELSITRISSMLGYARHSVFTEFFRNLAGMTPREFRDHRDEKPKKEKRRPKK